MEILDKLLGSKALLMKSNDAMAAELYGPYPPSALTVQRLGDIVILPLSTIDQSGTEQYCHIWGRLGPEDYLKWKGQHGGLASAELDLIYLASPLAELL
jgi:hypothetical protein